MYVRWNVLHTYDSPAVVSASKSRAELLVRHSVKHASSQSSSLTSKRAKKLRLMAIFRPPHPPVSLI